MRYLLLLVLLFILLARLVWFFTHTPTYTPGVETVLDATLLDEPRSSKMYQVFYVNAIRVSVARYPEFHYGDHIRLKGIIQKKIMSKKEVLVMENPEVGHLDSNSPIMVLLSHIRKRITQVFSQNLPKNESDLLLGIVFGIKGNMERSYFQALQKAGVLHVIAASGMNITMVGSFLLTCFLLFMGRKPALCATMGGIVAYAFLAGFEPSIIRATLMAVCVYSASLFGRQSDAYLSLAVACFLMLLVNPLLIQDVGFQLSFLSTLGLLIIKPNFICLGKFNIDTLSTTLSAQIATLPILLYHFGSYSFISIVVNALVLWTIPPLMILGAAASVFSFILPELSRLFLFFAYPLLLLFRIIVIKGAEVSSSISVVSLPLISVIGYYLVLLSLLVLSKKTKQNET